MWAYNIPGSHTQRVLTQRDTNHLYAVWTCCCTDPSKRGFMLASIFYRVSPKSLTWVLKRRSHTVRQGKLQPSLLTLIRGNLPEPSGVPSCAPQRAAGAEEGQGGRACWAPLSCPAGCDRDGAGQRLCGRLPPLRAPARAQGQPPPAGSSVESASLLTCGQTDPVFFFFF